MPVKKVLKIRPYARLLTMLGDQLIKNEKIALIELIKNSYDADANWVQIRFQNFKKIDDNQLEFNKDSYIEIEDDGEGMTLEIIKTAWMSPATPIKFLQKRANKRKTRRKKRIIQGEKGIGRFSVYKLGATVEIFTRNYNKEEEIYIKSDFSKYDDDFISENEYEKDIYLDELEMHYQINEIPKFIIEKDRIIHNEKIHRNPNGTIIRISNLKGSWSQSKIEDILLDVAKLQFPFRMKDSKHDFVIDFQLNNATLFKTTDIDEMLTDYFSKAPIIVKKGRYDDNKQLINLDINGTQISLKLNKMKNIKEFKKRFCNNKTNEISRFPKCGPFDFEFYVFDFSPNPHPKYQLTREDRKTIKKHRIYLYRDGIRVYPYGDPDDDWLGIDVLRGVGRAGDYLSMDQTFGYIAISDENNPKLKDKTNREGLIEIDGAFADFISLIQSLLGFIYNEFKKYKFDTKKIDEQMIFQEKIVNQNFQIIEEYLENKSDIKGLKQLKQTIHNYTTEKRYLIERAEKTEDLAAVGLAVEATSHDIMLMFDRFKDTLDSLITSSETGRIDTTKLTNELSTLRGQLSFIEDQLKGIQPLFRSTRRRSKKHRIYEIVKKVQKYYNILLNNNNINLKIKRDESPLIVTCTEAVLLQAFINLFDNAIYWLINSDIKVQQKEILIELNSTSYEVVFADNGPGVFEDDIPYIFNPFFSTKGLEGRGLGLYIARQLMERSDFKIELIQDRNKKILKGANFLLNFDKG